MRWLQMKYFALLKIPTLDGDKQFVVQISSDSEKDVITKTSGSLETKNGRLFLPLQFCRCKNIFLTRCEIAQTLLV